MGSQKESNYYDSNLSSVKLPLEESPWRDVYESAASLLPAPDNHLNIADLGCGTGRFAKLLFNKGYKKYWGIDFSEARIKEARQYVPQFSFSVGNLLSDKIQAKFTEFNVFVILEVLEHINSDCDLLLKIPEGKPVIFSVPNYDSAAHVRYFKDSDEIAHRYSKLLYFGQDNIYKITTNKKKGKLIFLIFSIKK